VEQALRFLNAEFAPRELAALARPVGRALLDPRRIGHQAAATVAMLALRERAGALPWAIQVEPSSTCDLRCPMCALVLPEARPPVLLDLGVYRRVLDEVRHSALLLSLWNWGEPLLHPGIAAMVADATAARIPTALTTNGLRLDETVGEALIRAGLTLLTVSVDAADAATYRAVHGRDAFAEVTARVARFTALRARLGARRPLVELKLVLTRDTEDQMAAFQDLARHLGADRVRFRQLVWAHDAGLEARMAPRRADLRRPHGIVPTRGRVPCSRPWMSAVVLAGGEVVPCCADTAGRFAMGRVTDPGGLRAIWNGAPYRAFRRRLLRDPRSIPICATCPAASFRGDTYFGPETR
jgi:MoaA/NifB/PqqE/SkfB family radical SAM enzyme